MGLDNQQLITAAINKGAPCKFIAKPWDKKINSARKSGKHSAITGSFHKRRKNLTDVLPDVAFSG